MITAQYFDGASTRLHPVHLVPKGDRLDVVGHDVARQVALKDIRISEPFERAPCVLAFTDGSHCAVHPGAGRSALLAALGYRPSRVERLQHYWKAAVGAIAALAGGLLFAYIVLLPMLTDRIAERLPADTLAALGDEVEQALMDQQALQFSLMQANNHEAVEQAFERIRPAIKHAVPLQVKLRASPQLGANALALPNGTIVVTDHMLVYAGVVMEGVHPRGRYRFANGPEERLAAVLAHEVAHLEQRHAMRKLVHGSLTLATSWALWGDFSGAASLAPVAFSQAKFSREMEAEADARAIEILKASGIAPARLAEMFETLAKFEHERRARWKRPQPNDELPDWMRTGVAYLASHPTPAERIARIRAAQ